MMDAGVPDEIKGEEVLQIEAGGFPAPPQFDAETIEFTEYLAFAPALLNITRYQVAYALRNLKSHLPPHGALRQLSPQRFEQILEPVSCLIACVIRLNAANLEPGHHGTIELHGYVVQQIPDTELLAQRGRAHRLFVLFD